MAIDPDLIELSMDSLTDVTTIVNVSVGGFEVSDPNLAGDGNSPFPVDVQFGAVGGGSSVTRLRDLLDVNSANLSDLTNEFVLTYNATDDKFQFVNPDRVLDAAVGVTTTDPNPVGLSTNTLNYLDDVLDNRIDLDAGTF